MCAGAKAGPKDRQMLAGTVRPRKRGTDAMSPNGAIQSADYEEGPINRNNASQSSINESMRRCYATQSSHN